MELEKLLQAWDLQHLMVGYLNKGFSKDIDMSPFGDHASVITELKNVLETEDINNSYTVKWLKVNNFLYKPGYIIKLTDGPFGIIKYVIIIGM